MAEQEDTELIFPQEYNKGGSTHGIILTENERDCEKDSLFYTITVVRKIHTESSRKGQEVIRLGEDMDYMERLHGETYFLGMSG